MADTATLTLDGENKGRQWDNNKLVLCFHVIQSEQITLSTDITDHIVEDHTSVQDHITIKPLTFTMRGLISEKVYSDPRKSKWNQWIEQISNKLSPIKVLAPTVNSYFQSAINLYEAIESKIETIGKGISRLTDNNNGKSFFSKGYWSSQNSDDNLGRWNRDTYLQKDIIDFLDYYRTQRLPVTVDTGWGSVYEPTSESAFYITDVNVSQGDTYQQSELSVTVKELRFTDIKMVDLTTEKYNRYNLMNKDFTDAVTGQTKKPLESRAHERMRLAN